MKVYRHGDVLLIKVSALPKDVRRISSDGDVVLAYGEVTGHAHRIKESQKVEYWDAGAARYLKVLEQTALTHEEHTPILLERGVYRQAFQVEEFGEEVRRVAD